MSDPLQVKVDGVTPDQWGSWLDEFSDANIFQTWSYGAKQWGAANLSHLVLHRGGAPAAAAQLRILRVRRPSMGIAYLRWGPLFPLAYVGAGLWAAARARRLPRAQLPIMTAAPPT